MILHRNRTTMRVLGVLTTVIGTVLVTLSYLWTTFFPATDRWSDEQAKEYSRASATLHQMQHTVAGQTRKPAGGAIPASRPTKSDLDAARRNYEEKRSEFDAARAAGANTAQLIRYGGVAIAFIGVVGLILDKKRVPKPAEKPDPFVLLD